MDLKKYLCVDGEHIRLIDYIFTDQDLTGTNYSYPKPNRIAVGGEESSSIFEKNNVPKEYQKMFISANKVNIKFLNKFMAKEYLTDTPMVLTINKLGNILGQMAGERPAFDVSYCYECNKEDVLKFLINLRDNKILDNYLKSISEIMHLNIKSYFDSNVEKVKKLVK